MTGPAADGKLKRDAPVTNVPEALPCQTPGKRRFLIWSTEFEIDQKYEPIKAIGKGAYGVVCSATDGNRKVAIKRVQNAFDSDLDGRRILREVSLLQQLHHENIINLVHVMKPAGPQRDVFKDVYLVYELMDTDLHQILRSKQPLSDEHFQYFLFQILQGLRYLHSGKILHRDLKPSNLLLNASCDLKICDFGLARMQDQTQENSMTEYVVTRWYRAPELLVNADSYTPAIDIWSVGCILGEMFGRKPLFPGRDYLEQLKLIVQMLGMPSDTELSFVHHERAKEYIRTKFSGFKGVDFHEVFPNANPQGIDLMSRMLRFHPDDRVNVEDALRHPYLESLYNASHDPGCDCPPVQSCLQDDALTANEVRERLFNLIVQHYSNN